MREFNHEGANECYRNMRREMLVDKLKQAYKRKEEYLKLADKEQIKIDMISKKLIGDESNGI
ncbi:hypothetical protein [Enterococcus cecorum]|uniref:hypothetical protein n=1 Tax=Enterococcus cecorum TaxID=44008 RepID=UPI0032C4A5A9